MPTTITTPSFDFDDSSSGTEIVRNEPHSFASDGVTQATTTWATSFAPGRYVEFQMNSPLRPGQTISSANFNFRYAGGNGASPSCFYVEVRNGTGTVLSTHGSTASPFGCVTGTTQTNFTVPLSSVTTTNIANDLVIRVYGRTQTTATTFTVDRATVSGTGTDGGFELFPRSRIDAADNSAATLPWSIALDDDVTFTNGTNWQTTFTSARYLKATFPGYVPAGSTNVSATLTPCLPVELRVPRRLQLRRDPQRRPR